VIDGVCVVAVVVKKVRELVRRGRHTNGTAHDTYTSTCCTFIHISKAHITVHVGMYTVYIIAIIHDKHT
jgi:hypothetical protein